MTILISGGGIAGLSIAIALAHHGIDSHLVEQADEFSEVGAGIQVGPNGMHILEKLGLGDLLENMGALPDSIRLFDGINGKLLNEVPLGDYAQERYGAPYKVLHRAELQMALLEKATSMPQITIQTGFRLKEYVEADNKIKLHSISGDEITGDLLIGADGMWSRTRRQLYPSITPSFYGKSAWRTIIKMEDAPAPFNQNSTGLWMAPNSHLVHYPVMGGSALNLVAVITEKFDHVGWSTPGQGEELLEHYKSWHNTPLEFLKQVSGWQKWALFSLEKLPRWSQGRVVLMGDAAHPPIPFLAQGGVMAIEDAFLLAEKLHQSNSDYTNALADYEKQRRDRVYRVMDAAHKNCNIYHMKGMMRRARNFVIQRKKPKDLIAEYDWLYGYRVDTNA